MKSAFTKNIFSEIKHTLNRFLAILAIVALGVGFVAGLRATAPTMKYSADTYFDSRGFMDVYLLSTFGFTKEDVAAVAAQPDIDEAYASYSLDALFALEKGIEPLKILAYSEDTKINVPQLSSGRMPSAANECAADSRMLIGSNLTLGSVITMSDENSGDVSDNISVKEYTIVGTVDTPQYLSFQRGSTKLGSGRIGGYIYVPFSNFTMDYYTEIYATLAGTLPLYAYTDAYNDAVNAACDRLKPFADDRAELRYEEILDEANIKISDAKAELDEKKEEASSSLAEAEQKIADGEKELESGKSEYTDGEKKLANAKTELSAKKDEYEKTFAQKRADLEAAIQKYNTGSQNYNASSEKLSSSKAELEELYNSAQMLLKAGQTAQGEALMQKYEAGKAELDKNEAALNDAKSQLDYLKQQIADGQGAISLAQSEAEKGFSSAENEISVNEKKLEESKTKLFDAEKALEKGRDEYNTKKTEAEQKLADAETEISDKEAELAALEKPKWYVLDRETNAGYVGFVQDTDKVDAIAAIFPIFFFMVAALVCLTTMTRMVEEQRTQIGVLKALGYNKFSIAMKYLVYADIACLLGCAAGLLLGLFIFPAVIMQAYKIMYNMPVLRLMPDLLTTILAPVLSLLCISGATLWACLGTLHSVPANLIRPKSPPKGKKIFMERITFLWKRLTFSQKVTVRNIVRYKKRFFMTVIGITGCTALVLTGYGLNDSISGILTKQFDDIFQYDIVINMKTSDNENSGSELNSALSSLMGEAVFLQQTTVDSTANGKTLSTNLVVPESADKLCDIVNFRTRIGHNSVEFSDNSGVVVTEKLAAKLGLDIGDSFTVKYDDTTFVDVKISGITENYTYNYIYMPSAVFAEKIGEPQYKNIWGTYAAGNVDENALSSQLLKTKNVDTVSLHSQTRSTFSDILKSLNAIVVAVIVSAGCLAFVVLYNLTNITITERIREIATIKVLGFFDKEVSSYVFRENAILTVVGTLFGLIAGVFLHHFVVVTAEVEIVMFWRNIEPLSYLFAAITTFIFAAIVSFVMYFKLKKVSMVESLKSVE